MFYCGFFLDYTIGSNWQFLPYHTLAKKILARVYFSYRYTLAITYTYRSIKPILPRLVCLFFSGTHSGECTSELHGICVEFLISVGTLLFTDSVRIVYGVLIIGGNVLVYFRFILKKERKKEPGLVF